MSRQDQSEAPCDYGCLSHAVGASAARQRGEVVRDDNDQTGRLGYRNAEQTGKPRSGSGGDDGGVIVGHVHSGLPQAELDGCIRGQERGYGGDRYQGKHGARLPYSPLATIRANAARVEDQPGDRPCGGGGEGLTGSHDNPAPTKTSYGDCWQWQRCSPGISTPALGTEVLGDFSAAANASGSREVGQPGDRMHRDDGERLAGPGLPRSRSGGDGYWQGRGCSAGRRAVELGMQDCGDHTAATHAGVSREAGRPGDGIHCDDSARLTRSGPPRSRSAPPRRARIALGDQGCRLLPWLVCTTASCACVAALGPSITSVPKSDVLLPPLHPRPCRQLSPPLQSDLMLDLVILSAGLL